MSESQKFLARVGQLGEARSKLDKDLVERAAESPAQKLVAQALQWSLPAVQVPEGSPFSLCQEVCAELSAQGFRPAGSVAGRFGWSVPFSR